MNNLQSEIQNYLNYCQYQKRLDAKTLKAYRIDLHQFHTNFSSTNINEITSALLENHIAILHQTYKPKTVKRKIASIKAFFRYLEYKEVIDRNPFNRMHIKFREPVILPKTIPLPIIETILSTIYKCKEKATTSYQERNGSLQSFLRQSILPSFIGSGSTQNDKQIYFPCRCRTTYYSTHVSSYLCY